MSELWKRPERNGGTAKVVVAPSGVCTGTDFQSESSLRPGEVGIALQVVRRVDGKIAAPDADAVRTAVAQLATWALETLGMSGALFVPGVVVEVTDVRNNVRRGVLLEYAPQRGTIALEELRRPFWPFVRWLKFHPERVVLPLEHRSVRMVADFVGMDGLAAWIAMREHCPKAVAHVRDPMLLARLLGEVKDMAHEVRTAFVERLVELIRVDGFARCAPPALAAVALYTTDAAVRHAALAQVTDEMVRATVAVRCANAQERRAIVAQLTQPDALLAFVLATRDADVGVEVVRRLPEDTPFVRIAREAEAAKVGIAAVARCESQRALLSLARDNDAESVAGDVQSAAADRFDALVAAHGVDATCTPEELTGYLRAWHEIPDAVRDAMLDRIANDEFLMDIIKDGESSLKTSVAAVQRLRNPDRRIEVAEECDDANLQRAALAGVQDPAAVLACAATAEDCSTLRKEAARRLVQLLADAPASTELAVTDLRDCVLDVDLDDEVRRQLVQWVSDEGVLAQIAVDADEDIGCVAVARMQDQGRLRQVLAACDDADAVACAVIAQLRDLELLVGLAGDDNDSDDGRDAARERCEELVREMGWDAVTSDKLRIGLARTTDHRAFMNDALARVQDPQRLLALACEYDEDANEGNEELSVAAVQALSQVELLLDVAHRSNAEAVRTAAIDRLRVRTRAAESSV